MPTIPFIQSFATLAASTLILSGVCGFTQPTQSAKVVGIDLGELRTAGYRIDWVNTSPSDDLRLPTITDHSIYVIDKEDYLIRYDLRSGEWLWSTPVGNKVYDLQSITEFPETGRVYVISDGAVYVVEIATGNYPSQIASDSPPDVLNKSHVKLEWVASTGAIRDGRFLVYGSSTGDTIWFDPSIGFASQRYRIGTSIHVKPTVVSGVRDTAGLQRRVIVTSAKDGSVIAVDANQVSNIWTLKLLDAVETAVSAGTSSRIVGLESIPRTSVFIAGSDQYLRSIDLHTGKPRWKILTTAPLKDTPFVFGESLYQRIPKVGLGSFETFPNTISGKRNWLAEEVTGQVITTSAAGQLVCWDEETQILQIVDTHLGGVVTSLSIPTAKSLLTNKKIEGSLFIITDDDTLLRLVPRG